FFNNQIHFLASFADGCGRYDAAMDSSGITREQAERLRQQVQRNLQYMNSLCRRMEKLGFPTNDPLLEAAMKARHAVQGALRSVPLRRVHKRSRKADAGP